MIKAIIFDCFGVLTTDGWHPFKNKYFAQERLKFDEAGKINMMANDGQISYQQMLAQVSELAGISAAQLEQEVSSNVANEQLYEYIFELSKIYKIGMLSNAAGNWLDELFTSEQLQVFDATVLSCDIGVNKPEQGAYIAVANKLGITTQECVFVDDLETYVRGAQRVGMQAIWYRDFDQFTLELEELIRPLQSE